MRRISLTLLLFLVVSQTMGQTQGRFSGHVMGDYYYVVRDHRPELVNRNGFWIRRVHLTYDRDLSADFSARLRLEMSQPGDFTSGIATPFLKDAYLRWSRGQHQLYLGISPSPTWQITQTFWGYRMVEKTPLDLQKMGDGRDFGLAAKGALGRGRHFSYHIMVGNGNGHRAPRSSGKKAMASLAYWPSEQVVAEVYGDFSHHTVDTADWYTFQAFVGMQSREVRAGALWARQIRKSEESQTRLELVSGFAVLGLAEKWHALARIDHLFTANPNGELVNYLPFDPATPFDLAILGIDFSPNRSVHLVPNLELVIYRNGASRQLRPKDLMLRWTFYFEL